MTYKLYNPFSNTFNWKLLEEDEMIIELKNIQQNQIWHKEGDVFTHTCYVIQEVLDTLNTITMYDLREILIYSALLHDIGKLTTTIKDDQGIFHAPGHAGKSAELATKWLESHNFPQYMIDAICGVIKNHMRISHVKTEKDLYKIINSLPYVSFKYLLLFKRCDNNGAIFDNASWKQKLEDIENLYYNKFSYKEGSVVKLTKIEDTKFNGVHPNRINVGVSYTGKLMIEPTLGCGVFIYNDTFHTSNITEIIDKNTFKTLNSIYKIENI